MKKLSLLLFAFCLSHAAWAASLNPYAYNLSSTWNEATQELTVRFKLNAHPNVEENNSGKGIQIFAIDPSDNNKKYYIYGVPVDIIKAKMNKYNGGKGDSYDYELTIPITGVTWNGTDVLPAGKNLTWAVNVQGLNSKDQASPVVVNDNIANRPYSPHGIAVNNDQNSSDFGSIYVTECTDGVSGNATWGWLASSKGRSLLKYDPTLKYQTSYRKHKDGDPTNELFSLRNAVYDSNGKVTSGGNLLEPHRVRISDDGRIFVSSYNKNTDAGKPIVWELDKTTGKFNVLIYNNTSYGHRVYGMDVKGSGNNIKILLCILQESTANSSSKFRVYEYSLNSLGANKNTGTHLFDYTPGPDNQKGLTACINNKYYHYIDGLLSVRYGSANRSDIFFGLDYFINNKYTTTLVYYQAGSYTNPKYFNRTGDGHWYGGAGFVPYVDQNTKTERIPMGRCYQGLNKENDGRIQVYEIADVKNSNNTANAAYTITTNTKTIVNDIAIDCAHNIYAVSFTDGTSNTNGTGRLIAIAMPYGGSTLTMAPSTNADSNRYFNVKPVPNILATDLRLEIDNSNQYTFSFNTNTKPEEAEIRFYSSYDAMKNSLNVVNADNYNGTNANKPTCVYKIPNDILKQGRIEVTLGGVGGTVDANGVITNGRIPAGELYWSVYVKTRESKAFAPIYEQSTTGEDAHYRLHVAVNNYPETEGFGHIYAVNYHAEFDSRNGLMEYNFNPTGNSDDDQYNIKNSNRYKLVKNYLNSTGSKPKFQNQRRLTVAPDGKVYIADCGSSHPFNKDAIRPWLFNNGGVYVWDPNTQTSNEIQISQFLLDKTETSTAVAIYERNGRMKLFATNTYGEYYNHVTLGYKWKDEEYSSANQADPKFYGWNGFNEYDLGTIDAIILSQTAGATPYQLRKGDGNGNTNIVATDRGIWMAQNRENDVQYSLDHSYALPDNPENYLLSFIPYDNTTSNNEWGGRTWRSCTTTGTGSNASNASANSQTVDAPLQSCPGAGLAYRIINGKEYLFIVQHRGDIAQFEIRDWEGTTPKVYHVRTYPSAGAKINIEGTTRKTGAITSMCFDYAGNLVTTSGEKYIGTSHDIIVYTMPYDRTNAREIQAPNSCRMIPERLAYLDMSAQELDLVINNHKDHDGCAIELFRPLQEGMFNTICLPFTLDFATLPADHPLKDADVRAFTGVSLETIGGEKVLSLVFSDITSGGNKVMTANVPYLLQPIADIAGSMRFDNPVQLTSIDGNSVGYDFDTDNNITFTGVIPITPLEANPLTLLLVANNRLAELSSNTNMLGFRGYFQLAKALEPGTTTKIVGKKPVTTNTTIVVDGKKVNVEKYLREGRVYIRVGETLYNITGEKVIR